jgi:uncharacterized protein YqhQ
MFSSFIFIIHFVTLQTKSFPSDLGNHDQNTFISLMNLQLVKSFFFFLSYADKIKKMFKSSKGKVPNNKTLGIPFTGGVGVFSRINDFAFLVPA